MAGQSDQADKKATVIQINTPYSSGEQKSIAEHRSMPNHEADGLQQQKTTTGFALLRLQKTQGQLEKYCRVLFGKPSYPGKER